MWGAGLLQGQVLVQVPGLREETPGWLRAAGATELGWAAGAKTSEQRQAEAGEAWWVPSEWEVAADWA